MRKKTKYNSLTDVQKAFYDGYDHGYHEASKNMKGKYVIIDLRTMDYMKDKDGGIIFFNDIESACDTCGMYEFEDAWVCKLEYNHKEKE